MRNKTIILGCGRLGSSIANENSLKGEDVIVMDADKSAFVRLDDSFSGITLVGDATSPEDLEEAGIEDASEVVITTGDDNINLFLTYLCAKKYAVPHIFVRFDDPDKGLLVQGMPVRPIYPFSLSRSRYNAYKTGGKEE